jgi:hypothetical protein
MKKHPFPVLTSSACALFARASLGRPAGADPLANSKLHGEEQTRPGAAISSGTAKVDGDLMHSPS